MSNQGGRRREEASEGIGKRSRRSWKCNSFIQREGGAVARF